MQQGLQNCTLNTYSAAYIVYRMYIGIPHFYEGLVDILYHMLIKYYDHSRIAA